MDKKNIQSDFKLLVDSAVDVLGKFNTTDRCNAINYLIAVVQNKFPESCDPIRRSFCGNPKYSEKQHSPLIDISERQQGLSQQQQQKGTDLNQNFEKILCKEEFQYIENAYLDKSVKLEVSKYEDEWMQPARNSLKRSYFNNVPVNLNNSMRRDLKAILSERAIGNSSKRSIIENSSSSIRLKCEAGQFTFHPDSEIKLFYNHWHGRFCSRSFKQQFRSLLQYALDYHQKPFLRKFFKNLVICGGIEGIKPLHAITATDSRQQLYPPAEIEEINSYEEERQLVPTAVDYFEGDLIKPEMKNGLDYMLEPNEEDYHRMVTYPMEDTSQTTDSSEDATNLMNAENNSTGSILNSIVGEEQPKVLMMLGDGEGESTMMDDGDDGEGDGDCEGETSGAAPPAKKSKPSYCCLLCPKSYRKRKSLIDHYKLHPGYCHDCGNPNGHTLEEIIEHNRTVHAKDFPFVCETCGESYSRRQQFHAHVEAHNKNQSKTYSCQECGMKFTDKKLHQQHLDETGHRRPDGAICEVCGAAVASKNALAQHIARVHKKDNYFECHICQNRFTLKANLERHVQLHTEIKRTYVCDECGSSYFTYQALKDHYSNAHTDASECKCTLCGKTFGTVKSLQRHLPSHSEERPHSCTYCAMTFKWKTHLVRHKQAVHGNQSNSKKMKKSAKLEEGLNVNEVPPLPQSPAKPTKKSSNSKPKQHHQQQQQHQQQQLHQHQIMQQQQQSMLVVNTPAPMPTSTIQQPSQLQQQQMGSLNNHASTSHLAESQTTMYSQNFNAENLLGQQCNPPQQSPQNNHQQQPPPTQQPPQQAVQNSQQRRTPNVNDNNLIIRMTSFNSGAEQQQYHFDPNATASYNHVHQQQQRHQQDQLLTQYQPQHLRTQTQSPMQQPQQHFQSPHHLPHHQQHIQHPQSTPTPPQLHHQQIIHQQSPHHSHGRHQQSPQPQQTPQQQQYPCASIQQSSADWNNLNFTSPTPTSANPSGGNLDVKDNKFYSVIHVNSTDFLGLPMDVTSAAPTGPSKQDTSAALSADLINFQNMWPHPPHQTQLNFASPSQSVAPAAPSDQHSYNNNIGSILTNLELIGNNNPMDYNFELLSQPPANSHHPQHPHPYALPSPSSSILNYDYTTTNHTLTDISDQKNAFQPYHHHQSPAAATPPPPVPSGYEPHPGTSSRVYVTDESKTILPPITDYMQHHPNLQQNPDVYYPSQK